MIVPYGIAMMVLGTAMRVAVRGMWWDTAVLALAALATLYYGNLIANEIPDRSEEEETSS